MLFTVAGRHIGRAFSQKMLRLLRRDGPTVSVLKLGEGMNNIRLHRAVFVELVLLNYFQPALKRRDLVPILERAIKALTQRILSLFVGYQAA